MHCFEEVGNIYSNLVSIITLVVAQVVIVAGLDSHLRIASVVGTRTRVYRVSDE